MSRLSTYIKIKDILKEDSFEKFENINLYGVLTFISLPKLTKLNCYCVSITLVDNSCDFDDKLKCITFSGDLSKSIYSLCKKGDIIRFHRLKIQKYNEHPQGMASFYSSWVAFDKDRIDFQTRTNKENISCIDDNDFQIVKDLREWIKTSPNVNALYDDSTIEQSMPLMNKTLHLNNSKINLPDDLHTKRFNSLSNIPEKSYINMICQICGICSSKNTKILIVWTGQKPEINFHKETDCKLDSNNFIYIQDFEYYLQIYVFDEHLDLLDDLKPGDFIALINLKCDRPKNLGKIVIKLSGGGQQYSRTIIKLQQDHMASNIEIRDLTDKIKKKGIDLNVLLLNEQQVKNSLVYTYFFNEPKFEKRIFNDTVEENEVLPIQKDKNCEKQIDEMLEDEIDAYCKTNLSESIERIQTEETTNEPLNTDLFKDRTIKSNLIRLSKYTFFTHMINSNDTKNIISGSIRLKDVHDLATKYNNFSCICDAKIFNYFTVSNPLITFVNVFCKKCCYHNCLPFHFVNAHEPSIASKLYLIDNYDEYVCKSFLNQENKYYLYKQNFNVDWLFDAKPSNIVSINMNQSHITSFHYDCPRCFWMNKESIKLDYVYRFSFTLTDNEKYRLGPCIIENDLALKLIDMSDCDPLEFCCVPEKATKVSNIILNLLNRDATFNLEVLNQENDKSVSFKEKIVYKIKDMRLKL